MPFDGTNLDDTSLLILRARDRLAAGWCRGARQRGNTFCAIGALAYEATGESWSSHASVSAAAARLAAALTPAQRAEAEAECLRRFKIPLRDDEPLAICVQYNDLQETVEPILAWLAHAALGG